MNDREFGILMGEIIILILKIIIGIGILIPVIGLINHYLF